MKRVLKSRSCVFALLAIVLAFGMQAKASDGTILRLLRPVAGERYFTTWIEGWEIVFEAKHPDGVDWVQIYRPNSKKQEPKSYNYDSNTGLFHYGRRFKSGENRTFVLRMGTGAGETIIMPDKVTVSYIDYIPDYNGFINLNDGDVLAPDTPFYVAIDCMDPDGGVRGNSNLFPADTNGVEWVALMIDEAAWETNYTERSFGYFEFFDVSLSEGPHNLGIVSKDLLGNISTGATIRVTAAFGPDSDGDALDDSWETNYFYSVNRVNGSADWDGDTVKDFYEYLYGSDPTDASSTGFCFQVKQESSQTNLTVDWDVQEGFVLGEDYRTVISTNLVAWNPLPTNHYDLTESVTNGMTKSTLTLTGDYGSAGFLTLDKP